MFSVPYVNTLLMSIFQIKIERNVLGRVGALMTAILAAITPIAYLCAGPLADYVFEPLMNEKGRGIGLIFIISGILLIISCLLMRLNKTVSCRISSGHLYAAMPPEIPSKIFLFFNIISLYLYYFRLLPFTFISSVKIHFPFFIR